MNNEAIPETVEALRRWLDEHCYNQLNYSIGGNPIHEGFGLEQDGGQWVWYYTERGGKDVHNTFFTEKEAVAFAFEAVRTDGWADTHCIGFTFEYSRSEQLAGALRQRGIRFQQDKIPYGGPGQPAYRTFVFGCDVRLVADLKEKFLEL